MSFDPSARHIRYFQIWRTFVKSIHLFPDNKELAKQACTAQALYVIWEAFEKVEGSRRG